MGTRTDDVEQYQVGTETKGVSGGGPPVGVQEWRSCFGGETFENLLRKFPHTYTDVSKLLTLSVRSSKYLRFKHLNGWLF